MRNIRISIAWVFVLSTSGAVWGQQAARDDSKPEALAERVMDRSLPTADRDIALARLQHIDHPMVLTVSQKLLNDPSKIVRARAAWILGDSGQRAGNGVLRELATESTFESVLAIESLGRLRDPVAHPTLLELLRREISREKPDLGRVSALAQAIADYEDPADAAQLGEIARGRYGAEDWVMVDAAGRTAGSAACGPLEDIFEKSSGWTAMSAGLGLARCGSQKGLDYVQSRLSDPSLSKPGTADATATSASDDDLNSLRATDFLLDRLGIAMDERLVPSLLGILDRPGISWRTRAKTWRALVRINPKRFGREILERAWKEPQNEFAVKFIVLHDEPAARSNTTAKARSNDDYGSWLLQQALDSPPHVRRRWKEVHGYTF